jgi:hypothetical protein
MTPDLGKAAAGVNGSAVLRSGRGTALSGTQDEAIIQQPPSEIPGGTSLRSYSLLAEI